MKLLVSLLVIYGLFSNEAEAARWGPNGHPEITFDAATQGELHIPEDIGKVLAIGSAAPDFFEFDNPAAHAQTRDPLTKDGTIAISAKDYQAMHETAYATSEKWSDFYFSLAVSAMKAGQRERAAFVLGYAIHNREDFATHRGMTNLVHSALDFGGQSPDSHPDRLAAAHEMASLELLRFKEAVGPQNWQLFRGETVRNGSVGSIIPEPLTLANSLQDWNPRSGIIPGTTEAVRIVQSRIDNQYETDIRGVIHEATIQRVENYLAGFFQRQDIMLEYLRSPRGPNDPDIPSRKGMGEVVQDALDATYFACTLPLSREDCLPKHYQRLTAVDRQLLGALQWEKLHKAKLKKLRELRQRYRDAMVKLYASQLVQLHASASHLQQNRKELISRSDKIKRDRVKWNDKKTLVGTIRPPSVNGNPPPVDYSTSWWGNSGSSDSSGSGSGGDNGGSSIDHSSHSPTINLPSNPNWDGRR